MAQKGCIIGDSLEIQKPAPTANETGKRQIRSEFNDHARGIPWKGGHRESLKKTLVPFQGKDGTQKQRKVTTYLGSKPYQPLSEEDLFQNAINPGNEAQHPKWLLDSKGGPAGCVPSRARGEALQEIPGLHVGLESLPVQCRPDWPFLGPSYIYRHNESSPQSSERQESPRSGLPRRLASVGDFVRGLPKGTGSGATHYEIPRFFNQRGKSSAETVPATCLARSGVGFGTF